jgi:putative PIN family toxin of toxin-antitoxin system
MRVVYDTNVLATILSRRVEILRLKQAVSSGRMTLVTSPFILNELEAVLAEKFRLTKQGAKSRTRLLARITVVVKPQQIEKIVRDPNDDFIIGTAVAGKAEYLVTLDKDLLVLKKHEGILIITPSQFKKVLP